jgi:hypothetical protein
MEHNGLYHYGGLQEFHVMYVSRRGLKIRKSDHQLRHVHPSVLPHGTTRLPLDGFSLNLLLNYFSKIWRDNSQFIKNLTRI